jgi:hypothetical protein
MSIASGDFESVDSAKTGYQILAGAELGLGDSPLALRFDATFGRHAKEGEYDEARFLFGANARLAYFINVSSTIRPYLMGGVGLMAHKHSYARNNTVRPAVTRGQFTYGGGAGLDITIGMATLFVEGRAEMGSRDISVMPVVVGLKFGSM